jgi:hypothetical protein
MDIKNGKTHHATHHGTLQPRKILINYAFAAQYKVGWGNFLKGRISQKWGKLLGPKRKQHMIEAFERSIIKYIWKHSMCQCDFRKYEPHKDKTRSVAAYKP